MGQKHSPAGRNRRHSGSTTADVEREAGGLIHGEIPVWLFFSRTLELMTVWERRAKGLFENGQTARRASKKEKKKKKKQEAALLVWISVNTAEKNPTKTALGH